MYLFVPVTSTFPPKVFQKSFVFESLVSLPWSMMWTVEALQPKSFCFTIRVETSIPCRANNTKHKTFFPHGNVIQEVYVIRCKLNFDKRQEVFLQV